MNSIPFIASLIAFVYVFAIGAMGDYNGYAGYNMPRYQDDYYRSPYYRNVAARYYRAKQLAAGNQFKAGRNKVPARYAMATATIKSPSATVRFFPKFDTKPNQVKYEVQPTATIAAKASKRMPNIYEQVKKEYVDGLKKYQDVFED